ncbi:MAG: hypothetical protein JWL85_304 [Candidatus Saccharibacteria bacterium]|nr:hypothetical protein [Candidatus Saccharibacteria bacterium]
MTETPEPPYDYFPAGEVPEAIEPVHDPISEAVSAIADMMEPGLIGVDKNPDRFFEEYKDSFLKPIVEGELAAIVAANPYDQFRAFDSWTSNIVAACRQSAVETEMTESEAEKLDQVIAANVKALGRDLFADPGLNTLPRMEKLAILQHAFKRKWTGYIEPTVHLDEATTRQMTGLLIDLNKWLFDGSRIDRAVAGKTSTRPYIEHLAHAQLHVVAGTGKQDT